MLSSLKGYLKLFLPYKGLLTLALLGAVLESLAYSSLSLILKNLIDKVLVAKNFELLKFYVFLLLGAGFFKQVGFLLSELTYKWVVINITNRLRSLVFKKTLKVPVEIFQNYPNGEWLGRITNDIKSFKDYSEGFGVKVVREIFTAVFLTAVLLYFDWQLFLLFLFVTPFLAKLFSYFGGKRKKYSRLYQEIFANFMGFVADIIENLESVKFFKFRFLEKLFNNRLRSLFKAEFKSVFYTATYLSAIEIVGYIFASAIILYGGWRVVSGELSTGTFISFIGTLFLLYNSLQALQRTAVNFKALEPILGRINEILNLPEERRGKKRFSELKEKIEVLNLNYPAEGGPFILKGINLSFSKGEKILIKGPSGGGKSTLLKVLNSLYRNYEGKIFYDENLLKDLEISTFRGKVFYMSQKVALLNDTVTNNLRLVKPNATKREIEEALKKVRAEFVFNLPKGIDTIVGKGGIELSGGQRQRIALARLFLLEPEVIFLDEATSALDPSTEREIIKEILSTYRDKTVFFVSHREGYKNLFNKILKVEGGKAFLLEVV